MQQPLFSPQIAEVLRRPLLRWLLLTLVFLLGVTCQALKDGK